MDRLREHVGFARTAAVLAGAGVLLATGLAAPANAQSRHAASLTSTKTFTVGFTNPTAAQPILSTLGDAIADRGKRLGVKVIQLDDQLSITKQISDIKQFIAEHVDGIIAYPLDGQAVIPALNQARAAGIKVLGLDALQGNTAGDYTLSAPYQADLTQGENESATLETNYLAKEMKEKGGVIGIGLSSPVPSITYLMARNKVDLTKGHPGIKWLDEVYNQTDNESGGQQAMAQAIAKYRGKIGGVIAYNDDSAIGAALALRAAGLKDIPIVGRNGASEGIQAVQDGQISADVDQEPYLQGATAMNLMDKLLKGKSVPAFTQSSELLVTKSNLTKRLSWPAGLAEVASGQLTGLDAG
jgi:ribose transport system substrate-binding protein